MKKQRPIKSIGRRRRVAGWTLLLLGLLVAAVWVASGWWRFAYFEDVGGQHRGLGFSRGGVSYGQPSSLRRPLTSRWIAERQPPGDVGREWWFGWDSEGAGSTANRGVVRVIDSNAGTALRYVVVELLLWPIPLLLWAPAALLLRSGILARRRAITGRCKSCGYDLAGLAAGAACPECGKGAKVVA